MLNVEHLHFRYPNSESDTLKDLSFTMESGQIFGFLGPSGSGKSTTQKILYKLLTGYEGRVLFAGKNLNEWGQDFYEKIGVCFELPNHYSKLSALENLAFFGAFYSKPLLNAMELLEMVGLEKDANKPVADYSKGMKMRLNFARALLHQPEFLFLDEPTSGLDPIHAKRIKDIIRDQIAKGTSIFITTHNMFDADQLCDEVALLHQGEIKALDKPGELKRKYGQEVLALKLQNGESFRFPLQGLQENTAFQTALSKDRVLEMHSLEASLEDAFIQITGEGLL
ncbi:MAG: ABC transporter ATP-binding protein [Bacteroidetes bacterium]|nr:MAG: ABC transporter ATP-binding protein [Bacteroidota bacterium]